MSRQNLATLDFSGSVAVVTAGASGIGRASATLFARAGASVVIADIDELAGKELARSLRDEGREACFLRTDVTREDDVAALYHHAERTYGRLDFCHNNAGGGPSGQHFDMSLETWHKGIDLNLTSVFLCLKHQSPIMARSGGGVIVNTASAAGRRGPRRSSIFYVAAKAGVIQMTEAAAIHFADLGIRVNCVAPGLVSSALARIGPEDQAKLLQGRLIKEAASPEDIADSVLWLCSPGARMITGFTVDVDGGAHTL